MTQARPPIGLMVESTPPEDVPRFASAAEELGFAELWVPEDYFLAAGVSSAVAALGATSTIPVGLGVVSAMVRHPAVLAMEIATIERLHPGRLMPGIGLGVPHWLQQMHLKPRSQLAAVQEAVTAVRRLLSGEEVTRTGQVHSLDGVRLTYPPERQPPIYVGAVGPKMARLSGEVADATIASVLAGEKYVRWLRARVEEGRRASGRESERHRLVTLALYSVDEDGARAREPMPASAGFYLAAMHTSALTEVYGVADELLDMYERGGPDAAALIAREMPAAWIDDLCVAGTPEHCAERIEALLDAGSDSVCLCPISTDRVEDTLRLTARRVLPALASRTPS